MESKNRIQSIIHSIDRKLGCKTVNLASAVKILSGGFSATKGTTYKAQTSNHPVASCKRMVEILDGANKATGYNDSTVTDAIQRLCDGYAEQAPLYSFGALSDLHIQYATGTDDFARALTYLKDRVPFTCVCGDLVSFADAANMAQYKEYVDTYAGDMPLYECAGNHETYPELGVGGTLDNTLWKSTTGKEPYYSFTYGNDVFLFLSLKTGGASNLFVDGGLGWLEQTLEANKNKRCFVFQHVQDPNDDGADPSHSYSPILSGTQGQAFLSLLRKYKNTVWFHGHTHVTFGVEQYPVREELGYRSVHIPSLASPRFYNAETNALEDYYFDEYGNKIWGSSMAEGYIVDVYEKKIVLRGINFAAGSNKDQVAAMTDEVYALETSHEAVIVENVVESIAATFTQGSTIIYNDTSLDSLKPMLVVTATWKDGTTSIVTDYTLSGTLSTNTSIITVTYEGKTTTFNVTVTTKPKYTNQVPLSIDTDGSIYKGKGYLEHYRLNSSGAVTTQNNAIHSGFIPYTVGSVIRARGSTVIAGVSGQYIACYDANFNCIKSATSSSMTSSGKYGSYVQQADGKYLLTVSNFAQFLSDSFSIDVNNIKYIRVSMATCTAADFIVTLDEEIE